MQRAVNLLCYSYKGGSGRSTAAVNIAFELARQGNLVACLDMDFGAPGLHMILSAWNKEIRAEVTANAGRVGLQDFFNQERPSPTEVGALLASAMTVPQAHVPGVLYLWDDLVSPRGGPGDLLFFFASTVSRTISDLAGDEDGVRRFLTKYRLLQQGVVSLLRARARAAGKADADTLPVYIVVDGPNGLTPVSLPLLESADLVLMFHRYSIQHVQGTIETARKIRYYLRQELARRYVRVLLLGSCMPVELKESLDLAHKRGLTDGYMSDILEMFDTIQRNLRDLVDDYDEIVCLKNYVPEDDILKTLEQPLTSFGFAKSLRTEGAPGMGSEETFRKFHAIVRELVGFGNNVTRRRSPGSA